MGNSDLPAAGWYPAPHAKGETRWWDGTRWFDGERDATSANDPTATTVPLTKRLVRLPGLRRSGPAEQSEQPAQPAQPALAEGEGAGQDRPPASMRRRTGAILAGSALIVGLLVGSASGGAAASGERDTLKAQVSALETEVADAETAADSAEDAADTVREDLETAQARATAAQKKLTDATAKVTALEAAAVTAQADLDARAAEIADLKTKVPASTEPVQSTPVQQASTPQNVSYANCTEARNAGAAPVRRGDPGYSSRLDRDGDGIGCE